MVKTFYTTKVDNFYRVFYGELNKPATSRYATYKIFDSKNDANKFIKKSKW